MAINGKTVLAVIPARGGSKRVPRKNLRNYRGKPLVQWACEAGAASKYIDEMCVSTEDLEIAQFVQSIGFSTHKRPLDICDDDDTCEDVIRDVLNADLDELPWDFVVLLQPTSPQRTAEDIDACIERAQLGHGCISTYMGKTNGAVYVASAEWLAEHEFSHLGLAKYEMPEERSLDINEPEDFDR